MGLVVVPIAGNSSRFKAEGIKSPKWSLPIGNLTALEVSLQAIKGFIAQNYKVKIVCLESMRSKLEAIILNSKYKNLISIKTVEHTPNGQALSVLAGIDEEDFEDHLIIWNCDSWINPNAIVNLNDSNNYLVCSDMEGDHWSFADVDRNGFVIETNEKVKKTIHASTGMYSFANSKIYINLVERKVRDSENIEEMYVAPLYNDLILQGTVVKIKQIDNQSFKSFGTPQDYFTVLNDEIFLDKINKIENQFY